MHQDGHKVGNVRVSMKGAIAALITGESYGSVCIVATNVASIVGTVFENTKLSLTIWFLAIHLMTQNKNAVSILELKRQLGVSYKTVWLIKHKLLQTMLLREERHRLDGRLEIDDSYLGGEKQGKRGRSAANKTPFVAAMQTNKEGRPHFMRLTPIETFARQILH